MGGQTREHKRSWRNLLLNRRYQLRFTLFLVGLSTVLMTGLGIWVMWVAGISNTVSANSLVMCRDPAQAAVVQPPPAQPNAPSPAPTPAAPAPVAPRRAADGRIRAEAVVTIEESMLPPAPTAAAPTPAPDPAALAAFAACKRDYGINLARIEASRDRIIIALLVTGVLLVIGLTAYGLKMTHRVAGPLHKVTVYLDQLRAGRYEPLHNLRRGDQLGEFYDHFKLAHAGVRRLDELDVTVLKAALGAAEQAGLAARSPELDAAMAEMRTILAEKEAALG
jgi:hypothetical protein